MKFNKGKVCKVMVKPVKVKAKGIIKFRSDEEDELSKTIDELNQSELKVFRKSIGE